MHFSHKSLLYSALVFFALSFSYVYFNSIKPDQTPQIEAQNIPDDLSYVKKLITDYYYKPVDVASLKQSNVKELLTSLDDPYSFLIESNSESEDIAKSHGVYQGLGFQLIEVDNKPMVITVMPLSSAFNQGIREGDYLVKINGKEVNSYTNEEFNNTLNIDTNQSVDLTFVTGISEKQYTLTATEYLLNTVFYSKPEPDLAYVRIILFRPQTEIEISQLIEQMVEDKIKYLILDLRGNTGGISNGADLLLNNLIELGTLYTQTTKDGNQVKIEAEGLAKLANLKIAVLVDRGTSSRAEIVAAALKENNRAIIIGEPSFGKGTIWQAFDLPSGGRIHLTTGEWFTPQGNNLEKMGITPDILVERPWEDNQKILSIATIELKNN